MSPADRVAERRVLLLDAAFDLLGTEGMSGTTVRAVCQRAALNARYFYESFDGLDTLVVAVYDRVVEELLGRVRDAAEVAGGDPRAAIRITVDTASAFVVDDPRRARVLYVEALGNETLNRRRVETGFSIARGIVDDAIARHGPVADQGHAGAVTAAVLVGGFAELLMAWLDGRLAITREQLVDDATELFVALGDAGAKLALTRTR